MKIEKTEFDGLLIIEPTKHGDGRGWFSETYNNKQFEKNGISINFVQDNHSYSSSKGILRGIHAQESPMAQTKLVRCVQGAILDVAVDLRKDSNTYKKSFSIKLSSENNKQLLIPKGFGHGFLTLTDNVEVEYKVDEYYSKKHEYSIRWDDPDLNIDWGISDPILSEKDSKASYYSEIEFRPKKVLITGSKGFIGKNLVNELLNFDSTIEVYTFDRNQKISELYEILDNDLDFIFHLAGEVRPNSSMEEFQKSNLNLTNSIVDYLKTKDTPIPILIASTVHAINPKNNYGQTKRLAEEKILDYGRAKDVKTFIFRLPHVFGEGAKPNHNSVISTWIVNKIRNEEINVYDREMSMTYVYVKDVVLAFKNTFYNSESRIYCNVKPDYNVTLGEVADYIHLIGSTSESSNAEFSNPSSKNEFYTKLLNTYASYVESIKGGSLY